MDFGQENNIEKTFEDVENTVESFQAQKETLDEREQCLSGALSKMENDPAIQGALEKNSEDLNVERDAQESVRLDAAANLERIQQELEQIENETDKSEAALELLREIGENVEQGDFILRQRRSWLEECYRRVEDLAVKLGEEYERIGRFEKSATTGEKNASMHSNEKLHTETPAQFEGETQGTEVLVSALAQATPPTDPMTAYQQYMVSHGWGKADFTVYSKDPEWRRLVRAVDPDYQLPPITAKEAYDALHKYMCAHNYGREDFPVYSQDPDWRELNRLAFPDYKLPPLNRIDNIGQWGEIPLSVTKSESLAAVNPCYRSIDEAGHTPYNMNCQRCVPTYEMRQRGYNVTVLPCEDFYTDELADDLYSVWENADVHYCCGTGRGEIEAAMEQWGDGSRAQICVYWKHDNYYGHTFVAERRNGRVHFIDPQCAKSNVVLYFESALPGETSFCRIDNLQPSKKILECCEEVK